MHRLDSFLRCVLIVTIGGASVALPALSAAAEPEVLLQDDFLETSANYNKPTAETFAKDKTLHLTVSPGKIRRITYTKKLTDADATVRVRLPDFSAGDGALAGLVFWHSTDNDYYAVSIGDSGQCGVEHLFKDTWYKPVAFRPVEGVKPAPGDWVELRVVLQGASATIYVNGKKFVAIKGHPSKEGEKMALYVTGGKKPITAEFAALKVVQPTDPRPANADPDPYLVLFKQDGATYDPGWPPPDENTGVRDGAMFFDIEANKRSSMLFIGGGAPGVVIDAKMRVVGDDAKGEAGGGFVVLAQNINDRYSIELHANGYVVQQHIADGEKIEDHSGRVPPTAKLNLNEWTALHVVAYKNNIAMTVNGQRAVVLGPRSPDTDSKKEYKFGLVWQADDKPCSVEFKDIVVQRNDIPY